MRFDCLTGQHTYKKQKIKLLKETDLVSFFDESTMSNLVDPCREIFLETSKILINQDYLKNTMYLSSFSINCNKTHYKKRLKDICFAILGNNLSIRPLIRLEAGVFGCARKRDDITDIFHTCDELN
jgi:hypothetical protein